MLEIKNKMPHQNVIFLINLIPGIAQKNNSQTAIPYRENLERFKKVPEICDSIIYNMRKGMRVKDTIPRIIVLDLLDQYKNTLDLDLEEKERILQKIELINKQISELNIKLKNKAFVTNAPKEIVQNNKNLVKELTIEDEKLRSIVSSIN